MPIRALFGMADFAVHPLAGRRRRPPTPTTTRFEPVDAGHFVIDERPDLVRAKLIALAEETAHGVHRRASCGPSVRGEKVTRWKR